MHAIADAKYERVISHDEPAKHTKRITCTRCLRPASSCICQWISPVHQCVQVLILQHPEEVAQAKGSARLLHLSLPNSRMVTGEVFAPQALQALLHGDNRSVLLYPESAQIAVHADGVRHLAPEASLVKVPYLDRNFVTQTPSQLQLVVLDATWRKSRKMLHLNPALQILPRLALHNAPPSNYRIRKAHRTDQLSTLEATCAALRQLGADVVQLDALLAGFEGFVGQQLGYLRTRRLNGPAISDTEPINTTPEIPH